MNGALLGWARGHPRSLRDGRGVNLFHAARILVAGMTQLIRVRVAVINLPGFTAPVPKIRMRIPTREEGSVRRAAARLIETFAFY